MAKKEILNNDAVTLRVVEDGPVEAVLDTAEKAIDATEQALDILENQAQKVVTITKNNPLIVAGALLVGLGIGGFVAYKVTHKRLSVQFDNELSEQIDIAKAFHRRLAKEGEFESPESAVQALVPDEVVEAVNSYKGKDRKVPYNRPEEVVQDPRPPIVVEEVNVTNNITVDPQNDPRDWDYRLEVADREANPNQPYVISFEEFHQNENSNEQSTLAYYAGDDTLVDERDSPIDAVDYTVGDDNLARFGHGSNDKNVVYIRNERLGHDFEVIRSEGHYAQEVLGLDEGVSIRHSQRREGRRQWRADE